MLRNRTMITMQWLLLITSLLLSSLYLSWQALAAINFLYPAWYEVIDIDENIATYGPRNRYRLHFEKTTKDEQVRLFTGIVKAIHNHGEGLESLIYHDRDGHPVAKLLTAPEITHLKDVSNLIDTLRPVGWIALVTSVLLTVIIIMKNIVIPSINLVFWWTLIVVITISGVVLMTGPVDVFYGLHDLVFPEGHAWFFYYEDSLMSMMMKAPDLFACIVIMWAILALFVYWVMLLIIQTSDNLYRAKK